jgi:catechol 2,3-dioxygenase
LQSDNFSDWKLSGEFMRSSPQFAANPIGVFFDPSRVYEAFQSGTNFATLQKTVYAGAFSPDPIPNIGLPA